MVDRLYRQATLAGTTVFIAQVVSSAPDVPNFLPAMKTTLPASGRASTASRSRRSQATHSTPASSSFFRAWASENRETPKTRRPVPASRIARWYGGTWSALGSGVDDTVFAIAVNPSGVYAGGDFAHAGGSSASCIARWDGSAWSAMGEGVYGAYYYAPSVHAIAVSGAYAHVGGTFTKAGGVTANYVARFDGDSWSTLGSGLNGPVQAIAVNGSDVYVGGSFSQAGGIPANYIARWVPEPSGIESPSEEESEEAPDIFVSPNPMESGATVTFQSIGPSPLTIEIYDTSGRLVKTQALGTLPVGSHTRYWDGCDDNGSALTSGVYFVRLSSEEFQASTRVVLVK